MMSKFKVKITDGLGQDRHTTVTVRREGYQTLLRGQQVNQSAVVLTDRGQMFFRGIKDVRPASAKAAFWLAFSSRE